MTVRQLRRWAKSIVVRDPNGRLRSVRTERATHRQVVAAALAMRRFSTIRWAQPR